MGKTVFADNDELTSKDIDSFDRELKKIEIELENTSIIRSSMSHNIFNLRKKLMRVTAQSHGDNDKKWAKQIKRLEGHFELVHKLHDNILDHEACTRLRVLTLVAIMTLVFGLIAGYFALVHTLGNLKMRNNNLISAGILGISIISSYAIYYFMTK